MSATQLSARFPDSKLLFEIRRLHEGRWPAPFIVHARRWYWIFLRRYELEICHACGRPVGRSTDSWWSADDALWFHVTGDENMVLCPPCFTGACRERGITVYWKPVIDDPEEFRPLPREHDPYLKGEGGNCGHTRVPEITICPLCWRRDGEWHQRRCPHDSYEWLLMKSPNVDEGQSPSANPGSPFGV